MKTKIWKRIVLTGMTALLAGCVVAATPGEVEVSGPPPAAEVEVQTVSPGPDYVWIGGSWVWGPAGRWNWEHGHWDRPPHPGAVWAPHHYEYRGGKHVFVRGRWK
jgi:hypothetical protein